MSDSWMIPDWPAPANVKAAISTRRGGVSLPPYDSNNMGLHVGDAEADVLANRQALQSDLGLTTEPQWLEQVHGVKVIDAKADSRTRTADGSFTRESGLACAVMTADCLPVLLCDKAGTQVCAVHAGWRGLAKGIVARALERFDCGGEQLLAYLGPAIGADHFEVGIEVLEAFFEVARNPAHAEAISRAFRPSNRPLHFYADLYQLAGAELAALGVTAVYGGEHCTYRDSDRFYSYRRERQTGRMVSLVWLTK